MNEHKTIIEINGVKLEVDLRTAKRIDELRIGSRVKCLIKKYNDWQTLPGVIIGFEPFKTKPSIVVAYCNTDYSSANLEFKTFNEDSKDFEIVADLDNNSLEVNKVDILNKFDREISKKELELEEVRQKKQFFLDKFSVFFKDSFITTESP